MNTKKYQIQRHKQSYKNNPEQQFIIIILTRFLNFISLLIPKTG